MSTNPELFKKNILCSDQVLDPEGIHHELSSGLHGSKLDFDNIPNDSQLFEDWIEIEAQAIYNLYGVGKSVGRVVLLSVATGTDRVVGPVAELLGSHVQSANTEKDASGALHLGNSAYIIKGAKPDLIVICEDVATTGGQSAEVACEVKKFGNDLRVEVLNTIQRRPKLEKLDTIGVPYNSIMFHELPTYTEGECLEFGYCSREDWVFIPRLTQT